MPIKISVNDFKNIEKLSNYVRSKNEPVFVTKNGCTDLVIMSYELYKKNFEVNAIDQAIDEAEIEVEEGSRPIPLELAKKQLDDKHFK